MHTDRPGLRGLDLHLGYHDVTVVHTADITLVPGRVSSLVGPNGSGKSTLLRALARLHLPSTGDIRLGPDTNALALSRRELAHHVTLVAQSRPVPTGLSVRDVVGFGRYPHHGRWRSADPDGPAAVDRAMTVTRIHELADRPVDEVSGGQPQRVWLAGCLAQDTGALLVDENPPTTSICATRWRSSTCCATWPTTTVWRSGSCCTTSTRQPRWPARSRCSPRAGSGRSAPRPRC